MTFHLCLLILHTLLNMYLFEMVGEFKQIVYAHEDVPILIGNLRKRFRSNSSTRQVLSPLPVIYKVYCISYLHLRNDSGRLGD